MKTSDFNFELPQELIAQTPIRRRDASRLLVLDKDTGAWEHRHFYDLPDYLRPGDCLILNNSRVLPARLLGHRLGGGACEILLLIDRGENTWECLVRPGKKLRTGARVSFGDGQLTAEITEELPGGNRLVHFEYEGIFLEVLDRLGKMPLPPYIKEELQDRERYQTVYSKFEGSVAAPTAAALTSFSTWAGTPERCEINGPISSETTSRFTILPTCPLAESTVPGVPTPMALTSSKRSPAA